MKITYRCKIRVDVNKRSIANRSEKLKIIFDIRNFFSKFEPHYLILSICTYLLLNRSSLLFYLWGSMSEKSLCLNWLPGDNHIHSANSLQFTFVTSINNSTILKRICTNIYDTKNNITDMSRLTQDFEWLFLRWLSQKQKCPSQKASNFFSEKNFTGSYLQHSFLAFSDSKLRKYHWCAKVYCALCINLRWVA